MSIKEITKRFREVAEQTKFPVIKEKLLSLAKDLESLKAEKLTVDMKKLTADLEDLRAKLETCELVEAAQSACNPFFVKLGKVIEEVRKSK